MPFDHKSAVIINFVELAVTVVLLCTTPRIEVGLTHLLHIR